MEWLLTSQALSFTNSQDTGIHELEMWLELIRISGPTHFVPHPTLQGKSPWPSLSLIYSCHVSPYLHEYKTTTSLRELFHWPLVIILRNRYGILTQYITGFMKLCIPPTALALRARPLQIVHGVLTFSFFRILFPSLFFTQRRRKQE